MQRRWRRYFLFYQHSWVDAVYWTIITMTTVGYGDLVPAAPLQKLYTILFMPIGVTTLAATVERFDKLNAAQRIHASNFKLVVDRMLRDEAIGSNEARPCLSEAGFVLKVLVEENLVEEATLAELSSRYKEMLEQAQGRVRHSGPSATPRTIDAETVYILLCQQGRVVDSNARAVPSEGADASTSAAADGEAPDDDVNSARRGSGGAGPGSRPLKRRVTATQLRATAAGMGRGATRGMSAALHGDDQPVAVDMSADDNGFLEWYEEHWLSSLREDGYAPTTHAGGYERLGGVEAPSPPARPPDGSPSLPVKDGTALPHPSSLPPPKGGATSHVAASAGALAANSPEKASGAKVVPAGAFVLQHGPEVAAIQAGYTAIQKAAVGAQMNPPASYGYGLRPPRRRGDPQLVMTHGTHRRPPQ